MLAEKKHKPEEEHEPQRKPSHTEPAKEEVE